MRGWAMGGGGIRGTWHHIGGDEGDAAHAMVGGVSGTHNCIQSGEDLGKACRVCGKVGGKPWEVCKMMGTYLSEGRT